MRTNESVLWKTTAVRKLFCLSISIFNSSILMNARKTQCDGKLELKTAQKSTGAVMSFETELFFMRNWKLPKKGEKETKRCWNNLEWFIFKKRHCIIIWRENIVKKKNHVRTILLTLLLSNNFQLNFSNRLMFKHSQRNTATLNR